jgi:hypothetical protein
MRKFNVTGLCIPKEDYMVDISGKIEQINDKGYCMKYTSSGKTIHKVAFAFLGRGDIAMKHTVSGTEIF